MDERLIYEILSVVEEIPPGQVATYGQIARLIGRERNARLVGRVLRMAGHYGDYPCHRVVDHSGRLAPGWAGAGISAAAGGGSPARPRPCGHCPLPLERITAKKPFLFAAGGVY